MNITMIPVNKIYPHPANPRTDLGDLTELTDSIKAMGVLQNLTVVPYNPVDHAGITITGSDGSDCYVTVAGNRRHAAARKAKLTELPCMISNMDLREQIRTMQVENILREGLTTYQQARGIQMMLDMGDSVEEIAKATGFSKAKVEKRAKLSVFDEAKFAESENRNPSLKDYLDLAKLEDEEMRNKLLESIGTANFRDDLARARSQIRMQKLRAEQFAKLDTFATKIDAAGSDMVWCKTITSEGADDIKAPDDADVVEYFYVHQYNLSLYRRKTPGEITAAAEAQAESAKLQEDYEQLKEDSLRSFELRVDFVEKLTSATAKKAFATISAHLSDYLLELTHRSYCNLNIDHHLAGELLGVPVSEKEGLDKEALEEAAKKAPERTVLVMAYVQMEDNNLRYTKQEWFKSRYVPLHQENSTLDRIYALLTDLGYEMSDTEKQLQDGTHPLYYQKPEEQPVAA